MATNQDFLSAMNELEAALAPVSETEELAPPNLDKICEIINKIKGPLELALPVIEKILGKTIAGALRLLLQLGDLVCPKL